MEQPNLSPPELLVLHHRSFLITVALNLTAETRLHFQVFHRTSGVVPSLTEAFTFTSVSNLGFENQPDLLPDEKVPRRDFSTGTRSLDRTETTDARIGLRADHRPQVHPDGPEEDAATDGALRQRPVRHDRVERADDQQEPGEDLAKVFERRGGRLSTDPAGTLRRGHLENVSAVAGRGQLQVF